MEYFIVSIVYLFYFLPTLLCWNKRNVVAIFFLNLLLGWTLLGWVIALVWAVSKDAPEQNQAETEGFYIQIKK